MTGRTRKKSKADNGGFSTMLTWTVLLALVFSAGLITGQRLLREQAMPPLVSLSVTDAQAAEAGGAAADAEKSPLKASFSFYEHLSEREAKADAPQGQKPVAEKPVVKPATEKPAVQKPEAVEEKAEKAQETEKSVAQKAVAEEAPGPAEQLIDTVAEVLDAPDDEAPRGSDAGLPARYTLQIGSHPDSASAQRDMDRLRQAGLEPHVIMVEAPGKGRIYRVRVGKFHSMDEARGFQATISAERGVASFVSPL